MDIILSTIYGTFLSYIIGLVLSRENMVSLKYLFILVRHFIITDNGHSRNDITGHCVVSLNVVQCLKP